YIGGECINLAPSNTTTKAANIGYSGDGAGCKTGFTYGTVNGQTGCHYHGQTNGSSAPTTTTTTGTTTSTTIDNGNGTTTTTTEGTTTSTTTGGGGTRCYGAACNGLFGNGDGG